MDGDVEESKRSREIETECESNGKGFCRRGHLGVGVVPRGEGVEGDMFGPGTRGDAVLIQEQELK